MLASREHAHAAHVEMGIARIEPWIYLVLGLATVPAFSLTPVLESIGAFLASLVHEAGHTLSAFLCGMPAMPDISLVGHASAIHSNQSLGLVITIGLVLAGLACRQYTGRKRRIAIGAIALIYPVLTLTGAKELLHLLAGHGAELGCATLCLWATLSGRISTFKIERLFYGTVGWYLIIRHFDLCFSLMRSSEVRAHYAHKHLFVLTNDYVRAAVNVLDCPLEYVVLGMLIASLLVLPLAVILWGGTEAKRAR